MENNISKQNIVPTQESYLHDYYQEILEGRSLPDVTDGLKLIHRRILYSMLKSGFTSSKNYTKCAYVAGSVLRYHPHGDTSVYDAMCNMSTTWGNNIPLLDFHGNLKSIYGTPSAASRYTEVRLSKFSEDNLLSDINEGIIDFIPSFDESTVEPKNLPAKLPLIFLNGYYGIAAGFASSILPHSLDTVVRKAIQLINEPDIDIKDYVEDFLPTFPSGGKIININAVKQAYSRPYMKNNSKVVIRATIEKDYDKSILRIIEIPFYKTTDQIEESIKSAVKNETLKGIKNIKNLSAKGKINIELNVNSNYNIDLVENDLYKYTACQTSIPIIHILTYCGKLKIYNNVKEIMQDWIDYRILTVKRIKNDIIRKLNYRIHIIDGLLIALDDIDNVIKIIKTGKSREDIVNTLIKKYDLSKVQADYIVDTKLIKINNLEIKDLKAERDGLYNNMIDETKYISDPRMIKKYIIEELTNINKKYSGKFITNTLYDDIDMNEESIVENIKDEDFMLILTKKNYLKKIPLDTIRVQKRGTAGRGIGKIKEDDTIRTILTVNSKDNLLISTASGKCYIKKCYEFESTNLTTFGKNISHLFNDDTVVSITPVDKKDLTNENNALLICTKLGHIKTTPINQFANIRQSGIILTKLNEGDEVIFVNRVNLKDKNTKVLVCNNDGKYIMVNINTIGCMNRTTFGNQIFKSSEISKKKYIISCNIINKNSLGVFLLTKSGLGKRVLIDELNTSVGRLLKGNLMIRFKDNKDLLVSCIEYSNEEDTITVVSNKSVNKIVLNQVPISKRPAYGCRIKKLDKGEYILDSCIG